jgi:hypothetical protein
MPCLQLAAKMDANVNTPERGSERDQACRFLARTRPRGVFRAAAFFAATAFVDRGLAACFFAGRFAAARLTGARLAIARLADARLAARRTARARVGDGGRFGVAAVGASTTGSLVATAASGCSAVSGGGSTAVAACGAVSFDIHGGCGRRGPRPLRPPPGFMGFQRSRAKSSGDRRPALV